MKKEHVSNIYKEGELEENATIRKFRIVCQGENNLKAVIRSMAIKLALSLFFYADYQSFRQLMHFLHKFKTTI